MDPVLKKRLIGAVALIALAVIFLPMLIKGPAPNNGVGDVPMKVPDEPADGKFVEIPLAAPEAASSAGAVGMPAPLPASSASSAVVAGDANAQLPPTTAAGDYAVNFGAYATQNDADTVAANLKQAGLPAYTASETVGGRKAVRVRIGNYTDRSQAEIVRLQALKVRNDVKASVVALDALPDAPAPQPTAAVTPSAKPVEVPKSVVASTPTPVKPVETPKPAPAAAAAAVPTPPVQKPVTPASVPSGFAVQVGAFGSAVTANALRDKARAAGLSAIVEQVNTDHGTLNRVRVGPVATHEQADALATQVKAKLGIDGKVVPHP